jgi:aspartate/methionine/tyrosine aminotransferase
MGFDLDGADVPLGYSQSNGTIELRERLSAIYPGATLDHLEVTNGTSEANYLIALSQLQPGDDVAMELPNYMQMPGVARSLQAPRVAVPAAAGRRVGAGLGRVRPRRHAEDEAAVPLEPQQPLGRGALRTRR